MLILNIGTEHLLLGLLRESGSFAAQILAERGVDVKIVREGLAEEGPQSDVRAGVGRSREVAQHWFQIVIVPEGGPPLEPSSWRARVPEVGEVLSVDRAQGESTVYQVVKVEWKINATAEEVLLVQGTASCEGDDVWFSRVMGQ